MTEGIIIIGSLSNLNSQEHRELRKMGVNTNYITNPSRFKVSGVGSHEQEGREINNESYDIDND